MKVAVTGASGYIGRRVVRAAQARGWEVVAMSRTPAHDAGVHGSAFDLARPDLLVLPAGIGAVVHLAADTHAQGDIADLEVRMAHAIATLANSQCARMVFVSSQTARADAPTVYGRTKFRIEEAVSPLGAIVVRPGQVYGGPERGLFGTLVDTVRRTPVLPAFFPAPRVQPVHVDDLVAALLEACTMAAPPALLFVAGAQPVTFTRFLRTIAQVRVRRPRACLPVPSMLLQVARAVAGPRQDLERLSSLFTLRPMQVDASLAALGLTMRPLASGMSRSGDDRRRRLLAEGCAFGCYVMRTSLPSMQARPYVRCIERLGEGRPLGIPRMFERWPWLVAWLDAGPRSQARDAGWRIEAAASLCEATPAGSARFLLAGAQRGKLATVFRMGLAVAAECAWRTVRLSRRKAGDARAGPRR